MDTCPPPLLTCPCCDSKASLVREINGREIAKALASFLSDDGIHACCIHDYAMLRCTSCSLEFCSPMKAADGDFYEWLAHVQQVDPSNRWEWSESLRLLDARTRAKAAPLAVLDVGCRNGRYLKLLGTVPGLRPVGIDLTRSSVENCLDQGFEAYCATLAELQEHVDLRVDAVTLWHVVEHVEDPVAILREARSMLEPGGTILFSVPLSPMSCEQSGLLDPLNLPPHHLTRWNLRSIRRLANSIGMTPEIILPRAAPLLSRIVKSILIRIASPYERSTRAAKLARLTAYMLRNPMLVTTEIQAQRARAKHDGRMLPDVALVAMK